MRKFLLCLMTAVCLLGFSACGGSEQETEEVEISYSMTFVNDTGHDITSLQLRPTEDYDWTDNMLTEEVWQNGYEVPVSLSGMAPVTENGWQVKVVFDEDVEHIWENVELGDGAAIEFTLEESDETAADDQTTDDTEEPVLEETGTEE
ncbi:hypothetical protein H9X85_07950 [Anaerotignum lactatifermentans]|uniref:DUF4430 domain-containing protein n=1 Tax=Anaerotignum lactatifermentans TaxID=160404 RepID=A0ABS2GA47_9FIRM|nr:hypothetical protein [Anaerotignum lactatifermentans]MBM6829536.1 hypothetical protein [Anaerotignum lactatifermentans]MBM6878030.1 hypothetical protein [Anaerotignum lactatifermentans]MBM6951140.1 hypothetical protein [Anaerotignum lactatifermentans]